MLRHEYRLKAFLPALLAVLSLLALTAPTCLCAHHEEKAAAVSCHGESHETASTFEGIAADSDCICVFAERPSAADRSTPEKITKDAVALSEMIAALSAPTSGHQVLAELLSEPNLKPELPDPLHVHSRGPPA